MNEQFPTALANKLNSRLLIVNLRLVVSLKDWFMAINKSNSFLKR